ncbi:MAG TPA: hypothetical protein PLX43_09270, partial [Nitrobacter sp.]|nr:hypothetical protein [Nitrobacter sp.]
WLHPLRSWSLRQTRGGSHRELGVEIRMALGKYAIDFPDALEGYADAPIMDAPIMTMKPWVSGN